MAIAGIMAPASAAGDSLPVGTIIAWGGTSSSVPAGWMLCNGKALNKSVYKELFTAIGTSWGSSGDKFNVPDLRGRFLRGEDGGTGRDPDVKHRAPSNPGGNATGVGSAQEDSIQNHTHDQTPHSHDYRYITVFQNIADTGSGYYVPNYAYMDYDYATSGSTANIQGATRYNTKSRINAGEESRPKNASVNFIIKVK